MSNKSRSAVYKRCQMIVHSVFRSSKRAEKSLAGGDLVLIVDDDEMVRRCLVRLIRIRGYMVEAYSSAEEFLFSKQLGNPVCLVLDATLPGMSGLELQRRLADESRRVPIIFMSAHDEVSIRAQALRGGAVAFLLKPFNEEALWSAMESLSSTPSERSHEDEAGLSANTWK